MDAGLGADEYADWTQLAAVRHTLVACYLLVMLLAVLGNSAIVYTVLSNRKMHTVVNYYIVNLAVCDLLVGVFVLPGKLVELTAPAHLGLLNDWLCTALQYFQALFVFASVLTLVATCLERCVLLSTIYLFRRFFSRPKTMSAGCFRCRLQGSALVFPGWILVSAGCSK